MSLYADYMTEVYEKNVAENEASLIVWTIQDDVFYLEDFYIKPEFRDSGMGKDLMEYLVKIAKSKGCTKLLGSITMACKYKDENMSKFLHYGFKIHSLGPQIIYLIKDI